MAAGLTHDVAVLFEFPTLNGGEHSMLSVLQQLSLNGALHFTALAPPEGPLADRLSALEFPLIPFTVRATAGHKRRTDELTEELRAITGRLQPAILHANSLSMSRLLGQARRQLPPFTCTGHLRDIMKLSARAVDDLNQLDGLAAVSQATADFHVAQGLERDRVEVVYNGVDIARFRRCDRALARRTVLPCLPASAQVILNVGQICLRKGQLELAQAVVDRLADADSLHLVLAGERHSGKSESIAYERAIADVFESAGRAAHLHRPGYCENIDEWMNAADLLVHTARQEPLGRVLLEAAACEVPIIATDVGGTSEIFEHQHSAFLIPPNDSSALFIEPSNNAEQSATLPLDGLPSA